MIKLTDTLIDILWKAREIETKVNEIKRIMDTISSTDLRLVELLPTLTQRELEILTLMTEGKKFKDIPKILSTSIHTIRAQRYNIIKKLKLETTKDIERFVIPFMQKKP